MASKVSVAVLYNQIGEVEYEQMIRKTRRDPNFSAEARKEMATADEQIRTLVAALTKAGFRAYAINVKDRFDNLHRALKRRPPDAVFNLVEFFNDDPTQESMVASLYELLRIPYTGAPPFTLTLCQRKGTAKDLLIANGIQTPRFTVLRRAPLPRRHGLHYPMIVKPAWEDASAGINNASVVSSLEEMHQRIEFVWREFLQPAIVEEFIEGREFHVPVLGNFPPRILPITEVDFSALPSDQHDILSYEAKWDPRNEAYHKIQLRCPAILPPRIARKIEDVALATYRVLGCRDYARVDMRLSKKNKVYVLEVNPNPDLSENDVFMQAAHKAGLSTTATLRKIVELALRRTPKARA